MKKYPTITKLFLYLFGCIISVHTSAQTFIGVSATPADNGAQGGSGAIAIIPPALMQSGDLVIIYAHYRNTSGTFSVSTAAGQTWNTGTTSNGANQTYFVAWCRYNGAWSGNPAVSHTGNSGTTPLSAMMYVFRPTNAANKWGVNVTQTNSTTNSATQSITGVTTTMANTVSMAFWSSDAAHTWGSLTGTGWNVPVFPLLASQVRNTTGSDISHSAAYKIMASAGATGNVQQSASASANTVRTIMSWHELSNDECSAPIPVSVNADATCTLTTAGSSSGATQSVAACAGGTTADDDVWFSFVASNNYHTITVTGGASPLLTNPVIEVFNSCGGTSLLCSNTSSGNTETATVYELTVGATYYYRVYSLGNGVGQGGFTNCINTPAPLVPANVATGKSFINITRPGGGTIVPGDELEIRVSVNVANAGSNQIFRLRYNDVIPANLTYVPGSLRLLTNEGKVYDTYTDAAGDDAAMYNAGDKTIRFNLGRDTASMPRGVVSNTATDSTSGGYVRSNTHAPRGNGMLVIVTYHVIVDVITAYNTVINYSAGALRYRNMLNAGGAIDYVLAPNTLSFIVYPNYGLCSNATGANNVSPGSGDFGSGTSHNGANPGTVPGYNYVSVATGNPGDGNYAVVKNLSPSQNTTITTARPETSATHRVFGVWDIIGDHTGATDPLAGNPPAANGVNGGYMLAVNSAYQLSVANNQTITGLCENTYYEFSAWFRNICKRCGIDSLGRGASGVTVSSSYIPTALADSSGVKPNLTFQIDGIDYYLSGDIDYIGTYGQWVKKGFVFMTGAGQTSVTISIKNNAPGGGGNDWAMDDIEFRTCLPNLEMRPSINPTYCQNGQVDISVAVSTFFNNFSYYQWERSTDNGATWSAAPESPSIQTFSYANSGGTYRDTVALPSFIAIPAVDGYRYRIRTSTSLSNIGVSNCAVYNNDDVVTVDVHPTCDVLPAQVTVFNVELKNSYAAVKWKVKNELSLANYTVERSVDGINFKAIGIVFAKGALVGEEQYLFNDPSKVTDKVYYRLRLTAVEGVSKFSNIVAVSADLQKGFAVSNLVNPFVSKISFQLETYQNGSVDIQLTDASGRMILQRKLQVSRGVNAMVIDVPAQLQSGSYLLRVVGENGVVNKVIQKK